jgi:acyl transferase domain-containing protein
MCTQNTHAMLAVGASTGEIDKLLSGMSYDVACKNASSESVLSGTNDEIDEIFDVMTAKGIKKTKLRVPFAFHSSQVQPILDDFETAARGATFNAPKIPVISPLLGKAVSTAGAFGPAYLARHCREPVDFVTALASAKKDLVTESMFWVENGPHPVVSGLLRSNLGCPTVLPTLQRNKDTWKVLTSSLSA